MISYLRRIRASLLSDGKGKKYILYAIGEVMLITIGLFIAMQLNNIKENRNARQFEQKMLREVQKTLIKDRQMISKFIDRANFADSCTNMMIDLMEKGGMFPDSMIRTASGMMMGVSFNYNSGAYEAIKSTGIDKISDDSIRIEIVDLYDYGMPRTKELIEYSEDAYEASARVLFEQFFESYPRRLPNGKMIPGMRITNDEMLQEKDFLKLISYRKSMAMAYIYRLEDQIEGLDKVLGLLERRLGPLPEN